MGAGTEPRVFLDASALFAAVYSETGGARLLLKLGEAEAIGLWTGPWVLRETEAVLDRKLPKGKPLFALLLSRARVQIGPEAGEEPLRQAMSVIGYPPDAQAVAEALTIGIDYFVAFDRQHLLDKARAAELPFTMGTAGDFLGWYRERIAGPGEPPVQPAT